MNLQDRIDILGRLKTYMLSGNQQWQEAKEKAFYENPWFLPAFIDMAVQRIADQWLNGQVLTEVCKKYDLMESGTIAGDRITKTVGIVMAGNIPLVGFHDFCCVFLSGHKQLIKLSSKDNVLLKHLTDTMIQWETGISPLVNYAERLTGCDAYIATGSNNSARYFQQYFDRFPHIIRKNRSSVAILDGTETPAELDLLADDIQEYFGLGCRNITQVWVPKGYDFLPMLEALKKYDYLMDSHKYRHNYDYVLAINIMNQKAYMTNGSVVLSPGTSPNSGISNLNYAYYTEKNEVISQLNQDEVQVISGHGFTPFGQAQCPSFMDYADGADTMAFLTKL